MSDASSTDKLEPVGMRAVRMGLVTVAQVEKALAVQKMLDKNGQHQLLGMVLVDLQMITTTQLLAVLHSYENDSWSRRI